MVRDSRFPECDAMRRNGRTGLHAVEASANVRRGGGHRSGERQVGERSRRRRRLIRSRMIGRWRHEEHPTGAHAGVGVARRLLEDRSRRSARGGRALPLAVRTRAVAGPFASAVLLVVLVLLPLQQLQVRTLAVRLDVRQAAAQNDHRLRLRAAVRSCALLLVAPATERDARGERVAGARDGRGGDGGALVARAGAGGRLRLVHQQKRVRVLDSRRAAAGGAHQLLLRSRRATRCCCYCCYCGSGGRCGARVRTASRAHGPSECE